MRFPVARPLARLAVALSLAALVGLPACGDDTAEPASSSPGSAADLDGREFLSTGSAGFELVAGTVVRLSFDGSAVSASAGCNQMSGTYTADGDVLRVGSLSMTEMGCDQPLMDQDTRLAAFLTGAPSFTLSGDDLVLTSGAASITFLDREVADPDRPLEGTRWVVDTIFAGDSASTTPIGVTATITIVAGTATVEAGCNTGSATVDIGDGTLTLGPLTLTKMACDEPAMTMEDAVVATLDSGQVTFSIESARLTLMAGQTGLGLQAAS